MSAQSGRRRGGYLLDLLRNAASLLCTLAVVRGVSCVSYTPHPVGLHTAYRTRVTLVLTECFVDLRVTT